MILIIAFVIAFLLISLLRRMLVAVLLPRLLIVLGGRWIVRITVAQLLSLLIAAVVILLIATANSTGIAITVVVIFLRRATGTVLLVLLLVHWPSLLLVSPISPRMRHSSLHSIRVLQPSAWITTASPATTAVILLLMAASLPCISVAGLVVFVGHSALTRLPLLLLMPGSPSAIIWLLIVVMLEVVPDVA